MDDVQRLQSREFRVDVIHLKLDDGRPVRGGLGAALLKQRHGRFQADGERRARRHDLGDDRRQPIGLRARDGFVEGHDTPDVPRDEADGRKFHRLFLCCRLSTGWQRL